MEVGVVMNILLVEDNEDIIDGLKFSLEENNYKVFCINTKKEAISFLNENIPNLIILDVTLPDGNGFDLYQNYIVDKNISTIFLTAKDSEIDIVRGLELGADDYITKPFSTKELLIRIKKILLRNRKESIIKAKDIEFDIDKMIVWKNNKELSLTALELHILSILFVNKGAIVRRDTILDKIWELTGNDVDDHTVTVYMKRIKDKLDSNIITSVKGLGYKIDEK